MKLKQIEIDGFGKLVKQLYKFGPGLNVIYGDNEAGKSTLQRSILAALYGFFDEGTLTASKKAVMAAYTPWTPKASYGLKLTFTLDNGREYRVERIFAPNAVTNLYDLKSGKSANAKFPSATQGRLFFAEELIGMPKEVFENTCLVRQAELAALEKSASAITDALLRLSASASQESTASQAHDLLDTAFKEQVGTPRSRNKPLPEAQRRFENLRASRDRIQSEHEAQANQMHELAQAEEKFDDLQRERNKAEFQRLAAQRQIVSQQRKAIEQADDEVKLSQTVIERYQKWATFPSDLQPKVQRLKARLEKAQSDAQRAEQVAQRAIQQLRTFYPQIESLHKSLNNSEPLVNLPNLESLSAVAASDILQSWLGQVFENLTNTIQNKRQAANILAESLVGISQLGHENISHYRQELGRLGHNLLQAEQAVQQIQQAAKQAGLPEDQWSTILSNAQSKTEKWKAWCNFPVNLRDKLLQLNAQYVPLHQSLTAKSDQIAEMESRLTQLRAQADKLQQQITTLEQFRSVPQNEKVRLQEVVNQLEAAMKIVAEESNQFVEIDSAYQREKQEIEQEKQFIEPLEYLGIAGLTTLQQRWLNATQQFASAQQRFAHSKAAWGEVGMPVAEYHRLEKTVDEIRNGTRPVPKPRSGCRSLFLPKQNEQVDQTPNEIVIYSKIQPIFAEYSRQRDDLLNAENALRQIEEELRKKLGQLIPETICEETFIHLLNRLQSYQQKAYLAEQHRNAWEAYHSRWQQTETRRQEIQARLEKALTGYGFSDPDIQKSLDQFNNACEKKEQLVTAENALERFQTQIAILQQPVEQFHTQQQSLNKVETYIINLLSEAGIQATSETLEESIRSFGQGIENYRQWQEAQSQLEYLQKLLTSFNAQIVKAKTSLSTKREELVAFRQQVLAKLGTQLPEDFSDQHLADINSRWQAQQTAQIAIDKVQGQLEQLQLQTQSIQRDLNDWVEHENATKQAESEIFETIHLTIVQTETTSITEAITAFDEAFNGFTNWQQAKRTYEAAIQAQQAVRKSLPRLETEIASIDIKLSELNRLYPEFKNLTITDKLDSYERTFHNLDEQVSEERKRLTLLQDSVSRGAKNLRHLAELDEELNLANAEVQRLSFFSQTLDLAINELDSATSEFQKMFAPRLTLVVEKGLEYITSGRYKKVNINPETLSISVLAPERKELVQTEQLSTGTRDLIYLILRLGITEMMSNNKQRLPILLDDPFVEFDASRQKAALEYLRGLSNQTQILLFTKDLGIRSWLEEIRTTNPDSCLIEVK